MGTLIGVNHLGKFEVAQHSLSATANAVALGRAIQSFRLVGSAFGVFLVGAL